MKGIPKEHLKILDRPSVVILAKTFSEKCTETNAQSVLAKNPKLFSSGPLFLRDTVISNIDTFILSQRRFYDIRYLAWQFKTNEPLKVFLVWVIIQVNAVLKQVARILKPRLFSFARKQKTKSCRDRPSLESLFREMSS